MRKQTNLWKCGNAHVTYHGTSAKNIAEQVKFLDGWMQKEPRNKKEAKERGRDPKLMQKQIKRKFNALQGGEEPAAKKETENLHMRPKYKEVLSVGVNPNFLSPNFERRFGRGGWVHRYFSRGRWSTLGLPLLCLGRV